MKRLVAASISAALCAGAIAGTAGAATPASVIGPDGLKVPNTFDKSVPTATGTDYYFDGGKVILAVPNKDATHAAAQTTGTGTTAAAVTPDAASDCPASFACVFGDASYGGRRLQFSSPGYWQNFDQYGFANQTSSVVNNRANTTTLSDYINGGGDHSHYGANSRTANVQPVW